MTVDMIFRRPHVSVPLVLPVTLLERVNRLALERGINRSALIREAIQATYFDQEDTDNVGDYSTRSVDKQEGGQWQ